MLLLAEKPPPLGGGECHRSCNRVRALPPIERDANQPCVGSLPYDNEQALASRQPVGGIGKAIRQSLDGDVAAEARVAGFVDFAHAPGAEWRGDLVVAQASSGHQRHER